MERFFFRTYPISTSFLLMLRVCLTSAYSIRMSVLTLWSPFKRVPSRVANDESLYIYVPSFILLLGAVFGGAGVRWFILPSMVVFTLPFGLKILTLVLILCFGLLAYLLVVNGVCLRGSHFMSTLWFLGFITSSPSVGGMMVLGGSYVSMEIS